jgi:ATP-dependent exoDNAse (exonuclease V) alpha subunit
LEASGYKVIGTSLAAKAAGILQDETGVPCFTVAQLEWELSKDQWEGFAPGTVVVIDESSMVGTRSFHRIARELRAAGGKLVAIGDVHQMPEVDAGGAFRGLMGDGRLRPVELVQNMRQLDPAEQARLRELRRGSVADALRSYDEAGLVTKADTSEDARNLLAIDWSVAWTAADAGKQASMDVARARSQVVMLGLTNPDVADLNRRARVLLKDAGVLTGPELVVGENERGFMVGDHVVTREISRRSSFHVLNGERWIVAAVNEDEQSVTLQFVPSKAGQEHRDVTVPDWYLEDGSLHHAYAVTVNIAQGSTVQSVFVMGSEAAYRQAVYTAASRPRDNGLQFYICREPEWVDDASCELPHMPATVDRRQMQLDLGDLGVLVPSATNPMDEWIRLTSRERGDSMSIDTRSPAEPVYEHVAHNLPPARPPEREQAGDTLDLGMDEL